MEDKMNWKSFLAGLVVSAELLGASPVPAQAGGGRGPGPGLYDPATVQTLRGVVQRVDQVKAGGGKGYGVHLLLKTDNEEIAVHLGPGWYVEKQALKIAAQDRLEIRGSRVTYEGKPALIAAEVKKGDQVLQLRNADGVPLWSGRGRRGS
jgi:hypothetical protein